MPENNRLFDEYKILENRYRADASRIWSQAQILIGANVLAIPLLSSVLSEVGTKKWLINPGIAVFAIGLSDSAPVLHGS